MSEHLDLGVEWLPRDHGSEQERAAFAQVRITVGDLVLTELYDTLAKTMRDSARLSVLHLGWWLAGNWWRLRWEPERRTTDVDWRLSHELGAAGGGFLWPPLSIFSDGEIVSILSRAQDGPSAPVRYLRTSEVSLPASEFEAAVDGLLDQLLARLETLGAKDVGLLDLWTRVIDERSDRAASRLRRREAFLGLDPDAESSATIDRIALAGSWLGDAALDEVMSAVRFDGIERSLSKLQEWSVAAPLELDVSGLQPIGQQWRAQPVAARTERPWERGHRLGALARRHLGLDGMPVTTERLSELMGSDILAGSVPAPSDPVSVGFRSSQPDRVTAMLQRGRHRTSRRFDVARLAADSILAPASDRALPITDSGTARQKVQRAFAQEFLCPVDGLRARLTLPNPDEHELAEAAEYYEVSEWVVITALVNHDLVSRDYLDRMRRVTSRA